MSRSASDVSNAGDLGRRIRDLRTRSKLSIEQVAERAGMAPGYLEYVEHAPSPNLSNASLLRLAFALHVPTLELLGGGQGRARGGEPAAAHAELAVLARDECSELLRPGGIGRVVFRAAGRPMAFPVNFVMLEGDIVFRSSEDGSLTAIASDDIVSFEVDRIDETMSEGWSVLATGTVHAVRDSDQLRRVEALGLDAWSGDRPVYFRLGVTELTGRRINTSR
jgi:transcriptional regulator with XRE-family HTH domain